MTRRENRIHQRTCTDCGYTTPVTTLGMAESWLLRHSCAQQRERDRRKAAVAARKAADGPRRDCSCPIARHEHGTRLAYVVDRCRCRPCRDANSGHQSRIDRLKAYGQFEPLTDAEPARAHIRNLQASGMGLKSIVDAGGMSQGGITKLMYGKRQPDGTLKRTRRIRKETAARILAIKPDLELLPAHAIVDPTGARRRLQALVAHGWSMRQLAHRMGMTESNFGRVIKGDDGMHAQTARRARVVYDELWDQAPRTDDQRSRISVSRAKRYATEHGWPPALAWDDDTIDDPRAEPPSQEEFYMLENVPNLDEIAIERFIAGDIDWRAVTKHERLEAARRMQDLGWSRNEIHARCHIKQQELTAALVAARHAA